MSTPPDDENPYQSPPLEGHGEAVAGESPTARELRYAFRFAVGSQLVLWPVIVFAYVRLAFFDVNFAPENDWIANGLVPGLMVFVPAVFCASVVYLGSALRYDLLLTLPFVVLAGFPPFALAIVLFLCARASRILRRPDLPEAFGGTKVSADHEHTL